MSLPLGGAISNIFSCGSTLPVSFEESRFHVIANVRSHAILVMSSRTKVCEGITSDRAATASFVVSGYLDFTIEERAIPKFFVFAKIRDYLQQEVSDTGVRYSIPETKL